MSSRVWLRVLVALALLASAGCASTTGPAAPSASSPSPTATTTTTSPARSSSGTNPADWPTYHRNNQRSGDATDLAPLSTPSIAWRARLDGAVYGQPLVVGGQILAATENDTVYALNAATGAVRWKTNLGTPVPRASLPCGDIDPLGITGTMAYDSATGRVFAVAETTGGQHVLAGIDAATGTVAVRVAVPPPAGSAIATQQRSALTVANGRVFLAYGGLFGDCGDYIGSVVSVTTAGTNPISYAIPTTREGGLWAPGGGVLDGDRLFYAVGNGAAVGGQYDGSDSVIALSTTSLHRLDLWAPSSWPSDNADDLDLGSANPALAGSAMLITGKRPTTYALDPAHLGGVGGPAPSASTCRAFGGTAVAGDTVYLPCIGGGVEAVTVAPGNRPQVSWTAPSAASGSPVIGGGAVWVVNRSGSLFALDEHTGKVLAQLAIGPVSHFASPSLSGNRAYVGTMTGVVAVNGA